MYRSLFGLDEKTVIIAGALTAFHKVLALQFLELGTDVVLVHKGEKGMSLFSQNLIDLRSIKKGYGRIKDISSPLDQPKDVADVVIQSAEMFGGVDVYIDTHTFYPEGGHSRELMTEKVLEFLKGRRRGRLIYCLPDIEGLKDRSFPQFNFENLQKKIKENTARLKSCHVTINSLIFGPVEEYLLFRFKEQNSVHKAMAELNKKVKNAKIIDYIEIAKVILFLASSMSSTLNGQVIRLNYGLY